jgi:hypothetical protein
MSGAPSLLDYVSESDLDRLADVIAALLIAGARRQAAASTDTAGSIRPPRAGDQLQTQDDRTSAGKQDGAVALEDTDRGQATTRDMH